MSKVFKAGRWMHTFAVVGTGWQVGFVKPADIGFWLVKYCDCDDEQDAIDFCREMNELESES